MKIRTFVRHLREGVKNIFRNGWMSIASISTICISLFILGVFVLLAINVNSLTGQIESQVEIRAYLQLNTDQAAVSSLENQIRSMPEVKSVTFISKEEGLESLRDNLGQDGKDLLEGFSGESNPLPDSFSIKVFDPQTIAVAAAKVEAIDAGAETPPFLKVKYGQGPVETLFKVTNVVRNIGLVIVAGLSVTAMFLISTTIRMTIQNRSREIGIMKLVGATNAFIRWPFFVEGALIGFFASSLTTIAVLYGYSQLFNLTQIELGLMMIKLVTVRESALLVGILLIGIGTVIGVWGSMISVRKYLKV